MRLQRRWVDSYTVPGQYVAIRMVGDTSTGRQVYGLSSSPYAARRDSSLLDASIVEVINALASMCWLIPLVEHKDRWLEARR